MDTKKFEEIGEEFVGLLRENAIEAGRELASDLGEVRDYVAARMAHLSRTSAEPGFREALVAERDSIAMKAAGRAIDRADAFDARILGLVEGVILVGSKALAAIA
jgi:hypothetical protein